MKLDLLRVNSVDVIVGINVKTEEANLVVHTNDKVVKHEVGLLNFAEEF